MTTSESKGRFFLQNESFRITNRIDSNRELECSSYCWTQAQKAQVQIVVATVSGNSLRQTAHTDCASVHQTA